MAERLIEEESVDAQFEGGRPDPDRLAMEQARARAEFALFGKAEPPRFGRYTILERIARGGMGVVYSAFDPELERRVALKVVDPLRSHDERLRRRMVTEARALAKLDHPNVVKVHDVLTVDNQIVIVLELVEGDTLAAWQADRPRGWREAVAVYLQAADGLAAAHGVDVIHRDFKPSNVVVGVDGRVRVLDFGLARVSSDEAGEVRPEHPPPARPDLTQTGDVLGTLGYASPEQLRGTRLSPASDQFSFCVSLHYAVEGVNPFIGDTVTSRLASITAHKLEFGPSEREVPAWLRAVIARGLSPDPSARFASVAALADELRRPRGLRRWRTPLVVAAIAGGSAAITLGVRGNRGDDAVPECDGGVNELAGVWNAASRARASLTLAGLDVPVAVLRDRAITDLDRYATAWSDAHRAACQDHRRGASSAALLDRRMVCLHQRLGDLAAALEVIGQTDRATPFATMDVIARIPPVARCADLERLQADIEPPELAIRDQVTAVRERISAAEALSRAGNLDAARRAASEVTVRAKRTNYPPVEIEAALAESRILIAQRDLKAAAVPLREARKQALELKMHAAAVEAAARLLYVEGMQSAQASTLEHEIAYLIPLAAGRECDHFVRPLLLNNIGAVYSAIGNRGAALDYFQRAKRDIGTYAPVDLELTVVDRNIAMLTPQADVREPLAASAWSRLRDSLGEFHPSTLEALVSYAEYVADPAVAYRLMSAAADAYRKYHASRSREIALADVARAFLARELGDRARVVSDYERAVESSRGSSDPDVVIAHHLAAGERALVHEEYARAIGELSEIARERLTSKLWYERADGLRAEVDLGLAELARHRDGEAQRHFERALAGYREIVMINEEVSYRRLTARAQHGLASSLRHSDPARAAQLDASAMEFYRSAGSESYRWLLETPHND